MTRSLPTLRAQACLALGMSLVGCYVALSKPLAAALPVLLLAWLRFGIGAVAMAHWLRRPAGEPRLNRHTHQWLFLEALLGNVLFSVCMLFGMRLTSAVSAGVIMASIPAVVALMSRAFLGERIAARVWVAIACAAGGIALLGSASAGAAGARTWLGDLLLIGAVVCEASYVVIGKKLTGVLGTRRIASLINLWGFALVTPPGLYLAFQFDFAVLTPGLWLLLVFYALAASVWTVQLWMTGLKFVPAAQAGVFTVMLPVAAALVGVLMLGERPAAAQLAALGLALAGVLLATLPGGTASAPASKQCAEGRGR